MSVCRLLQWFLTGYVVESAIYAIVFIFSNLRVRIMLNNIGLAARKCTEPTVKLPFECKIESNCPNSQDLNYTWRNLFIPTFYNERLDLQLILLPWSKSGFRFLRAACKMLQLNLDFTWRCLISETRWRSPAIVNRFILDKLRLQ